MAVKKSIAIIGEGETEWWYFDTLRVACRYKFKVAPDFPQHSDIPHMAKLAEDYVKRETDYVVCLVDMDRLLRVPAEMATYLQLKKKSSRNVIWIETNPCTEFWFLLHFLPQISTKHYETYEDYSFLRRIEEAAVHLNMVFLFELLALNAGRKLTVEERAGIIACYEKRTWHNEDVLGVLIKQLNGRFV